MMTSVPNFVIQKGLILLKQSRYKDAAQIFKDALSQHPQDSYVLYLLASCLYHLPGQLKIAVQTIDQALRLEPNYPEHHELKALILSGLNKHKEALLAIDDALNLNPYSAYAHANKSYIFIGMQKWTQAEGVAREALSLDPNNLFAGNMLATALQMQNKLDENQELVSDMLAKDPEDASAHSNAGWVYFKKGNFKQAVVHFREALRLDPNLESARIGMLETFKVKSLFYGLYIRFSIFMARQTKSTQIMIILGIYLGFRFSKYFLENSFNGQFAFLAVGVSVLWVLLIFWSWFTHALGNLIVLMDNYARYALKRDERFDALFVGGSLLLGIVLLMINVPFKYQPTIILGGTLLAAAFPFSLTFTNGKKTGRILYGSLGILIWMLGLFALGSFLALGSGNPIMKVCFYWGLAILTASTLFGAFGFLRG